MSTLPFKELSSVNPESDKQTGKTAGLSPEINPHSEPPSPADLPTVLAIGVHALPAHLLERTEVLPASTEVWWERLLTKLRLGRLVQSLRPWRQAWALFRAAIRFDVVVTDGARLGLTFAALQKFRGRFRPVHVMYDCYWYHGSWLRRAAMRFCLREVDLCVVWTRVECARYAREYGLPISKFAFVRHHHTLKRYQFDIADDGYLFTGGNSDRDYRLFFDAVRDLQFPCILATNLPSLLKGLVTSPNVRIVNASPTEFRQLMAKSRVVVIPMRANLLRTGGQQTFLNAMCMRKPVILTDPEGGADYIQNGKTGLLVPYGDPVALRDAIRELWDNPEEARALGDSGYDSAVQLTTERCNTEIWNLSFDLVRMKRDQLRPGDSSVEPGRAS
jgi:glycosyltransferase involved in cell wall biosynthesis